MKRLKAIYKCFTFSIALFGNTTIIAQVGLGPAPYCMPDYSNEPCNQPNASNNAANTINDFIQSFNTTGATNNIVNNNSGCNSQVLSSSSGNYFFVGCPIFLRVTPGHVVTCYFLSGITYDQGFAVFIDWNQNNVFDWPPERVASVPGTPPANTWCSANFTVPGAQAAGIYRMRVRCAYAQNGSILGPCVNYSHGETEDYRLIVGAAGTCSVLPVELISYDGLFKNNSTELNWSTATEINSDHFTIERSYDNQSFELISKIESTGNSNSTQFYSTVDKNPKRNTVIYYRLKQFDKGSTEENFSRTLTLYANDSNMGFDMFPNPANTQMTLVMPDVLVGKTLSITIYDNYGKKVLSSETTISEENTFLNFDINTLGKGTYFVQVLEESGINLKKILIKQ
jgi:hypothetical protein